MIDLDALDDFESFGSGVSETQLQKLEDDLKIKLPDDYVALMRRTDGFALGNGLTIYRSEDLVERNETFEVFEYAPGYLAIGDDSGGLSILISLSNGKVYSVDQGSMDEDDMEILGNSLFEWLSAGGLLAES
ncbi:hypothetical protein Misp06_02330 [Microbulbifer sp. NBRC 101763]|uniref:SMI1/KNR4 family protein n=1 Tax=Microbulbifer TaxID=48073 RepID=UPI00036A30A8|nr:SMI1/KNR4 family protein [Microbulbifer variabilis]